MNFDIQYFDINEIRKRCEMDSHANTCVAGSNCVVLEFTGRTAEVKRDGGFGITW